MKEDSLIDYRNPGIALPVADALTEVLRRGAGTLLQEAVEAEVAEVIDRYRALQDERGRQRWCVMATSRPGPFKPALAM